jgi:hypothetical protein
MRAGLLGVARLPRLLGAVAGLVIAGMATTVGEETLFASGHNGSLYTIDTTTKAATFFSDASINGRLVGLAFTPVSEVPPPAALRSSPPVLAR